MRMGPMKAALFYGAAASAILWSSVALAQEHAFDVPSEDAVRAIPEFARQAGIQIVAPGDQLKGVKTPAIKGSIELHAALKQLLAGTGFEVASDDGQTILLTVQSKNVQAASNDGAAKSGASSVERVIVTGTRIEGAPVQGAVELKSYSREQIENSGQPTVAKFLNTLSEVSQAPVGTSNTAFDSQSQVILRGFPVGTTLVLIDGQRVANGGAGGSFFDLNNIPQAMVERIDVLPIGSSAIYGSDAIAGVVNIITKKRFDGVAVDANFGLASRYSDQTYAVTAGKIWDRASFMLSGTYQHRDPLFGADRALTANADFSRFATLGGTDTRLSTTYACTPGTVSRTGGNLSGLTSSFAAIPAGITSKPTVAQFASTAGTQNLCSDYVTGHNLLPGVDQGSVMASGSYAVTDEIELYANAMFSHVANSNLSNSTGLILAVPASNAFNPFGVPVTVNQAFPIESGSIATSDFLRVLVGAKGPLFWGFDWEVNASAERTWERDSAPNTRITSLLNAALASSDPTTAFNPFSTSNPQSLVQSIFTTRDEPFASRANYVEGILRGSLFDLPGGPVETVLGGSFENEYLLRDLRTLTTATTYTDNLVNGGRDVAVAFGEARVPVLPNDRVVLSAAARYSNYGGFGGKTTPQIGLEVRPIDGLLLRASYAESFRAPPLVDTVAARVPNFYGVIDPLNGNASVIVPGAGGGNPNLLPETGSSKSVGLVWTGTAGLTASATYWRLNEDNRIVSPNPTVLLANPTLFPGHVIRDATGKLTFIDLSFVNFGGLRTEGLDIDVTYAWDTQFGQFSPFVDFTETTKFLAAITPGQALVNRLGRATLADTWAPRWKGTVGFGWKNDVYAAGLSGRYLGSYLDYQNSVGNTNYLGNYVLWDAYVRYDFGRALLADSTLAHDAYIGLNVRNLFDKQPQFSNFANDFIGYDPFQADPLGRVVTISLGTKW